MTNLWDQSVASHKRRIEHQIVEVALEMIAEKGMSEVSMSELAKRAGVSRQTLYNYFPDVAHVVLAWMELEIDQEYERLTRGLSSLNDPIDKLSFYVRNALHSCAERQHHAGVEAAMGAGAAMSDEAWALVSEKFSKTRMLLQEILEEGVSKGLFRESIDVGIHANLIFHMTGSIHHAMGEQDADPEVMSGAIMDMVLNGIKA